MELWWREGRMACYEEPDGQEGRSQEKRSRGTDNITDLGEEK